MLEGLDSLWRNKLKNYNKTHSFTIKSYFWSFTNILILNAKILVSLSLLILQLIITIPIFSKIQIKKCPFFNSILGEKGKFLKLSYKKKNWKLQKQHFFFLYDSLVFEFEPILTFSRNEENFFFLTSRCRVYWILN